MASTTEKKIIFPTSDEREPQQRLQDLASEQNLDTLSSEFATFMDERDVFSDFRNQFHFPPAPETSDREQSLYLCGNSLGLQPKRTQQYVMEDLNKWATQGVEGHFTEPNPWLTIDDVVVESSASLVGALKDEVVVMNSLTTNLNLLMLAFYTPTPDRYKILIEQKPFPSDMYAVKSQLNHHGYDWHDGLIEMEPREGETCLRTEDILATIEEQGDEIALILFPGLQYYTGQLFDMEAIAAKGHEKGCVVGFDLAHAVGNAPLALHDWQVDFAVWCSYKYLNSGPGSIGGAFVHENHFDRGALPEGLPRVVGWWAHRLEDRFEMGPDFVPIPGAYGFRQSNPPSLLVMSLKASLDVFEAAGEVGNLRSKSELLTAYLEHLLLSPSILPEGLLTLFTPSQYRERGCQLSLSFTRDDVLDGVFAKLSAQGVICDVRKPRVIRIAPTPLYNSFQDVWDFVQLLNDAVREEIATKDA